jgi:hypothetical protein
MQIPRSQGRGIGEVAAEDADYEVVETVQVMILY